MLRTVLHGNESCGGQMLGTGQGKYLNMGKTKYVYSELEKSTWWSFTVPCPSFNIVRVSWMGCVGHKEGRSTVDEGVHGTYLQWTLRFKSDHPPHVLSTEPRSYVKNGTISSTRFRTLQGTLFSMYILVVSLTLTAIPKKMAILLQIKHLLAQMWSPVSEARWKIFDTLGTVSILQPLSN